MRERAINLRDWEVRAILDGRKTMIRRPVKPQPDGVRDRVVLPGSGSKWAERELSRGRFVTAQYETDGSPLIGTAKGLHCHASHACPFGAPGDLLWARECFSDVDPANLIYRADFDEIDNDADCPRWWKWRHSIHMPRWASRLTLRVTDVRVERVQDITEEDARAEGFDGDCPVGYLPAYQAGPCRYHFASSWSDTYGAESWTANPWCWCVSFERAEVRR